MKRKILTTLAGTIITIVLASCNQPSTTNTITPEVSPILAESTNTIKENNVITNNIQSVDVDNTGLTINQEYIINLIDNIFSDSDLDLIPDTRIDTNINGSILEIYINSNYFMSINFFNNSDITINSIFNCNNNEYSLSDMEDYFLSELGGYSAYLIDMYSDDEYKELLNVESNNLDWIVTLRNEILIDAQNLITYK